MIHRWLDHLANGVADRKLAATLHALADQLARNPWVPWAVLGVAVGVVLAFALFQGVVIGLVLRAFRRDK